jgi:thioredoxin-related protein
VSNLQATKVVLVVFAMDGCPACADFTPRFTKQVEGFQHYRVPFVFYSPGQKLLPGQIPVLILDGTSQDPSVVSFADQYQVSAMPTTILLTYNAAPYRVEGAISDQEIYDLLSTAAATNR